MVSCYIYAIVNAIDGIAYIGSSELPRNRIQEHIKKLAGNKHYNKKLQEAYNQIGLAQFDFVILDTCLMEDRELVEYAHINTWKLATYNITKKPSPYEVSEPLDIQPAFSYAELIQIRTRWG